MLSSFVIKQASVNDSEIIAALGRRTFLEAHKESSPKEDMDAYLDSKFNANTIREELSKTEAIFHIIDWEGKPAGYSKIILNTPVSFLPANDAICKFERLYIDKPYYGKKLGYKLFEHNKAICIRSGQSGMWLTVWTENEPAIAFYERLGFRIVGEVLFTVGKTQNPNYVMWLEF